MYGEPDPREELDEDARDILPTIPYPDSPLAHRGIETMAVVAAVSELGALADDAEAAHCHSLVVRVAPLRTLIAACEVILAVDRRHSEEVLNEQQEPTAPVPRTPPPEAGHGDRGTPAAAKKRRSRVVASDAADAPGPPHRHPRPSSSG